MRASFSDPGKMTVADTGRGADWTGLQTRRLYDSANEIFTFDPATPASGVLAFQGITFGSPYDAADSTRGVTFAFWVRQNVGALHSPTSEYFFPPLWCIYDSPANN